MQTLETSPAWPISMGPPVWGCDQWGGSVYPNGTPKKDYLRWYCRTFNAVEGNSTFYGLPSITTVQKWAEDSLDGFEFCLKFPRAISHDSMLVGCDQELIDFMDRLSVLAKADRLGPTFLQLGPSFGPDRFDDLRRFLMQLSGDFQWAVEVRHPGWFDDDASDGVGSEQRLDELLRNLRIDRVLFDSRALFSQPPQDDIEVASQSRKPNPPHRETVTATRPMIRMVGRNDVEQTRPFIDSWVPIVTDWIRRGLRPIIFTHAPDDRFAPDFARLWMNALADEMPDKCFQIPTPPASAIQPSLFD